MLPALWGQVGAVEHRGQERQEGIFPFQWQGVGLAERKKKKKAFFAKSVRVETEREGSCWWDCTLSDSQHNTDHD